MTLKEILSLNPDKKELRKFGFRLCVALIVLGSILLWRKKGLSVYFLAAAPLTLAGAVFLPIFLKPFYKTLMALGRGISLGLTNLTLMLIFYIVFTPMGLFARLFGKDILNVKFKEKKGSFWIPRDKGEPDRNSCENQY